MYLAYTVCAYLDLKTFILFLFPAGSQPNPHLLSESLFDDKGSVGQLRPRPPSVWQPYNIVIS
jgi:hypothetical protein